MIHDTAKKTSIDCCLFNDGASRYRMNRWRDEWMGWMNGWMGSKESIVHIVYSNGNKTIFFIYMLLHRFFSNASCRKNY